MSDSLESVQDFVARSEAGAQSCLEHLRERHNEFDVVYEEVRAYIRWRYLLSEADMETDGLDELTALAVKRLSELDDGGDLKRMSSSCTGSSSAAAKKILLMMSLVNGLHIEVPAAKLAAARTVRDLAAAVHEGLSKADVEGAEGCIVQSLHAGKASFAADADCPAGTKPFSDAEVRAIREQFPVLKQDLNGHSLVYLDNAATMQVPESVVARVNEHYHRDNANVHRGIHALSERSTQAFEHAREQVASFIGADSDEVIFTGGTTHAINAVARMWESRVGSGDAIAVSIMEHHANFVPWQELCTRTGATFSVVGVDNRGNLRLAEFEQVLAEGNVSLVAVAHVSNVTGCVNPLPAIVKMAHAHGAAVLVDAAQGLRHEQIDVHDLGCEFLCFSGHKLGALTGIGVLYGSREVMADMHPEAFGGEMVDTVRTDATAYVEPPIRFEAGTPNYVGAISLGVAVEYLRGLGLERIARSEEELLDAAVEGLRGMCGVRVVGDPELRRGCVSFFVDDASAYDVAALMNRQGVAVRSGYMCAQPLINEAFGLERIVRVSPAFYNTRDEIDACIAALERSLHLLRIAH